MPRVRMPSSVQARKTRMAISPRLATRTLRNGRMVMRISPALASLFSSSTSPDCASGGQFSDDSVVTLWLHPAGFQDRLLDRFVVIVVIGWLALAADTGGELFKVADVARDILDRDGLPAGRVTGVRLAQAEACRGRLKGLHNDRALGPADRELPAFARPDFHRGALEDGDGALELEDRDRIVRKSVLGGAVMADERGDRARAAEEADEGINEVAAEIEHHAAGKRCQLLSACGRDAGADAAVD